MIALEKWAQIRQMYFHQKMSMRSIAKTLRVNRRTVKKAVSTRGGPRYHRTAPYRSILDPFKAEIRQMIEDTQGKVMATVIYEHLSQREDTAAAPQYHGSYENIARYVHQVKQQLRPKEAFLRIETPPGFDAQCDWGKVDLVIANQPMRLSMFVLTLSYSRFRFARLFLTERQEFFFTGHKEAFEFFGGLPQQVTYDNLTTAVAKVLTGTNRQEQEAFIRFRGEFPFDANFAAPGKGNEKGKVENGIKYIRSHAFGLQTEFPTLSASNAYLLNWLLDKDAQRVHSTHKEVIFSRYLKEKSHLAPLPRPMPPCCRVVGAKVNKFSFVQFETNRYSVPTQYVYQQVIIKAFEQRIQIICGDTVIASHLRVFERHTEQINPYHFLALLEQKARAVDHAVVMSSFDLDPVFYQLKEALKEAVENPNRQWIRILRLSETHSMPQLVVAVKQALAYGVCDYASIVNFLLRQVTPQGQVNQQLCLSSHPQLAAIAVERRSLSRYDALLAGGGQNGR